MINFYFNKENEKYADSLFNYLLKLVKMKKSIFVYGDLNSLKVSFRDKLLEIGFCQLNNKPTLFMKGKKG